MNLRQIEIFQAVITTGSISSAAKLLNISTPAVSRALSHTESRLGFLLFERLKGRLYPTHEAKVLYEEIKQVYQGVRHIERISRDLKLRREGFISIIASHSLGQMFIPAVISKFHEKHPSIRIRYESMRHQEFKESLLNRDADLGISLSPVSHPDLKVTPVAQGRLLAVCPKNHPIAIQESVTVEDLVPYRLISYRQATPFANKIDFLFKEHNCTPDIAIEVGSPQNACALVQTGSEIALVDEFSLLAWDTTQFAVLPVQKASPFMADLVYLCSQSLSPIANSFVSILNTSIEQFGLKTN